MRGGGRILVLLGLVFGIIAAGGTFVMLSNSANTTPLVPTKMVVVAQQNVNQRDIIASGAVALKEWPESALPPTGFLESTDLVVGKLALVPIFPGQLVLSPMIVDKKDAETNKSDASFLVPEGKVAVAFPLTDLVGVSGAIQAGDLVDVLLTLNPSALPQSRVATAPTGTEGLPATQLMLQNVQILQVGTWANKDKNAPAGTSVTLVLSRQDALAIKSARELGIAEFALRPATKDKEIEFKTESVTLQYLNRRFNFNLLPASAR
jgi:pilus assembly protein CpaB